MADHAGGVRPGRLAPADQLLRVYSACSRRLLGMCSVFCVLCRPLCGERQVAGHPVVGVEALQRARPQAHLDFDVVVDVDLRILPFGIDVGSLRQWRSAGRYKASKAECLESGSLLSGRRLSRPSNVARLTRPRRHHPPRRSARLGLGSRVDIQLVAMRLAHRAAQAVRLALRKVKQRAGAQPVRQLLRPSDLGNV